MNARSTLLCLLLGLASVESDGAQVPIDAVSLNSTNAKSGFTLLNSSRTGVTFTNQLSPTRHLTNNILLNGSGVACGDVDGDGSVDIYFAGLDGMNVLYRNLGDWKFEDITARAGVACDGLDATGVAFADLDGDGDLDLVVNSTGGGTHIFFNDGKAHFTPSPQNPLNRNRAGESMALADIDGNGSLDLYIANYRIVTIRDQPNTRFVIRMIDGLPQIVSVNGRPLSNLELTNRFKLRIDPAKGTATAEEEGEADLLLLNDGKGDFREAPFTGGRFLDEDGKPLSSPPFDWGLSVMLRDLNGDGAPDIYVCNDFRSPDRIWINDGHGNFRELPLTAIRQTSQFSMGLDVADVNRDGVFDIFVTDMLSRSHQRRLTQRAEMGVDPIAIGDLETRAQTPRNTLQLGRGDGTFAEVAQFAGVEATEWSWTPAFLDVDIDGYEDLLVANGFERDGMNADVASELMAQKEKLPAEEQLRLRARYPRLNTPNVALRNLGNGRFTDASALWHFDQPGISQGMALADLDGDGDLDVVINNLNGPAFLFRNDAIAPRVAVRLKGLPPNTRGIGAKITVSGGPVVQSQEMICGGRYLSSDDSMRVFAAFSRTKKLRIDVLWRSGRRSVVDSIAPNTVCVIDEKDGQTPTAEMPRPGTPLFLDVSTRLKHQHAETSFDDFVPQPLLPRKFSQIGSGVSWFDFDGDGLDDLILPSGRRGSVAAFRNDGRGGFVRLTNSVFASAIGREQTTALGSVDSSGNRSFLLGLANDDGRANGAAVVQFNATKAINILGSGSSSLGPLAMADVDGDGALDLFVGTRLVPGRYPEPAPSALGRQVKSGFNVIPEVSAALAHVGLVSGAVFTDLNNDGAPDLVLACEWGPLRIFENRAGQLVEMTQRLGMTNYAGWWTSVTSGDFDGDGRLDLVAGNWGENSRFEFARAHPLRVYFGDFDEDGQVELVESYFDATTQRYVPARQRDALEWGMPWLRQRFPTWNAFSRASVDEVLGDAKAGARLLEANWLSTTVFLNRGDHFEVVRLPDDAQFSPAFGVCVADFDGDGTEDVFLAQNFFGTTSDTSRFDAGRGLLIRGDGRGHFRSVPGQESGIVIYGEQRGAAVCDFDGDGRVDLAVAQNAAETKLFRNQTAKPGLRVRLQGTAGNVSGVGAVLRIGNGGHWGPSREIHAGSGYWSQDSALQVLARAGSQLQVRWPGGKVTVSSVPPSANEVVIDATGDVKVTR